MPYLSLSLSLVLRVLRDYQARSAFVFYLSVSAQRGLARSFNGGFIVYACVKSLLVHRAPNVRTLLDLHSYLYLFLDACKGISSGLKRREDKRISIRSVESNACARACLLHRTVVSIMRQTEVA